MLTLDERLQCLLSGLLRLEELFVQLSRLLLQSLECRQALLGHLKRSLERRWV